MKRFIKPLIILVLAVVAVVLLFGLFNTKENGHKEEYDIVLKWTGLTSYPAWEGSNLNVDVLGNSFTREFLVSFTGSKQQLEDWIKAQEVLRVQTPESNIQGIELYILSPQNGANGAEVIVNFNTLQVTISASWS